MNNFNVNVDKHSKVVIIWSLLDIVDETEFGKIIFSNEKVALKLFQKWIS